jgi:hypothetical protein
MIAQPAELPDVELLTLVLPRRRRERMTAYLERVVPLLDSKVDIVYRHAAAFGAKEFFVSCLMLDPASKVFADSACGARYEKGIREAKQKGQFLVIVDAYLRRPIGGSPSAEVNDAPLAGHRPISALIVPPPGAERKRRSPSAIPMEADAEFFGGVLPRDGREPLVAVGGRFGPRCWILWVTPHGGFVSYWM